jgi:hypothetical protein
LTVPFDSAALLTNPERANRAIATAPLSIRDKLKATAGLHCPTLKKCWTILSRHSTRQASLVRGRAPPARFRFAVEIRRAVRHAGGRAGAQFHDCHDGAQPIARRTSQPDAGDPETPAWPLWLGETPAGVPQLKALLAPYPSEEMICWPVSARVGNVKNNDPSLIEPVNAS